MRCFLGNPERLFYATDDCHTGFEKTSEVSEMCRTIEEPVFVTKNGQEDMVIMSIATFERTMFMQDIYSKVAAAEQSIKEGRVMDGFESLKTVRAFVSQHDC